MVFEGSPAVVAHRGMGSGVVGGYAENTLSSVLAAVQAGADWVEVDVRRTLDDRLVVAHNPEYDDGSSHVATHSREAGRRGVLLLDELLEALPPGVGVDFDLKTAMEDALLPHRDGTLGLLAPVAQRESRRRPVALVSFDPAAVTAARELAPGVARGLTTWLDFPVGHAVAATAHMDVQFLGLHEGSVLTHESPRRVLEDSVEAVLRILRACRRELLVWCPQGERLRQLAHAGVDAVCVNDVPSALVALGRLDEPEPRAGDRR